MENKEKLNIVIIMGGISTEREISLKTGNEIFKNIDKKTYNVEKLLINEKKDIFKLIDLKKDNKVDFVYNALHGAFGEDGTVQSIMDTLEIEYSGTDMISSAICMDKNISKIICKEYGVNIIPGNVITRNNIITFEEAKKYGNKLVLKPFDGGSSIGLYIVDNEKDYDEAIQNIFKISEKIILEKYIKGVEISVPVIDGFVYPTVKITPLKSDTFDYESKYTDGGALEEVFFFDDRLQNKINEMALKSYEAVGCKAFARIDFLVDEEEVYMLEINTLPGMTENSILPKSLKYEGVNYSATIDLLIYSSMKKYDKE